MDRKGGLAARTAAGNQRAISASVIEAMPWARMFSARSCQVCGGMSAELLQMAMAVSRCGEVTASCIAVMPPIDTPATAARSTLAASSTASTSAARSAMV